MAVTTTRTQTTPPKILLPNSTSLGHIPDPNTPSCESEDSRTDSVVDEHHPDLNDEISKMNDKLVNAINHQFSLDDALQQTRHELNLARKRLEKLEAESKEYNDKLKSGLLVHRADVDQRVQSMSTELAAEKELRQKREQRSETELASEKEARAKAEQDKRAIEQELETLTSALFQEANSMVVDARKAKEASDRKTEHLKNQLADSEVLLASHQEQLADLKMVMEKMLEDQTDGDSATYNSTNAPPSPAMLLPAQKSPRSFESNDFLNSEQTAAESTPHQPLYYSNLIQPVFRTDVTSYQDFDGLIKQAKAASRPSSRVISGSFISLGTAGIAGSSATATTSTCPSPGIPTSKSLLSTSPSPSTPPSCLAMKESRVFKRALVEDIEPTLRLDIAPGVSWISRRPIVNSMVDGSLVVEPMPPSPFKYRGPVNQCALCGENRIGETYARNHSFRISENIETRRFPLCDLCLGRLRSCCELLSFLRMVSGGHWRADSDEDVKAAWEEYVRLREQMFWHRVAAGVIPTTTTTWKPSPVSPTGSIGSKEGQDEHESLPATSLTTKSN